MATLTTLQQRCVHTIHEVILCHVNPPWPVTPFINEIILCHNKDVVTCHMVVQTYTQPCFDDLGQAGFRDVLSVHSGHKYPTFKNRLTSLSWWGKGGLGNQGDYGSWGIGEAGRLG